MKVLVDTNVWIDFLRQSEPELRTLLEEGRVYTHPLVIGELALGHLKDRDLILEYLKKLKSVKDVTSHEVFHFIESRQAYGKGVGIVDVMILCAVILTPQATLWTRDKRLEKLADECGVAYFTSNDNF